MGFIRKFSKSKRSYLLNLTKRFEVSLLGRKLEDLLAFSGVLMAGFSLFHFAMEGQCSTGRVLYRDNRCDPVVDRNTIPCDRVLMVYLSPIICQVIFKGASIQSLCLSWAIGLCMVIASFYQVSEVKQEIWTIFYSIFFLGIIFSIERCTRITYLEILKASNAESARIELITQKNEAEMNLEQNKHELIIFAMRAEEEKRLAEKEQEQLTALIGNVAHDLKTPLQSIKVDLELLGSPGISSQLKDNGEFSMILKSLNAASRFMIMAINRSIDFAKASGNIALVPSIETFNVINEILVSVDIVNHLQSAVNIIVHPLPFGMSGSLLSDKTWFSENVFCLLSNAVKYCDAGSVDVSIELLGGLLQTDCSIFGSHNSECREHNLSSTRSVRISIEDTGIGLSNEVRDNLFRPFKQSQRRTGGTGLGLFSLYKRMEALGGLCGFDRRKDGKSGSIFWFEFTYRPDRSSELLNPEPERNGTSNDKQLIKPNNKIPSIRIMLVDDSLTIIKGTSRSLMKMGCHVTTASNGSLGLDRLIQGYANNDFDVVLMDLQMPVMGGIEAVRRYREYERAKVEEEEGEKTVLVLRGGRGGGGTTLHDEMSRFIPCKRLCIIGMSANSDNATKESALAAGMDLFIGKPFGVKELQKLMTPSS